MDIASVGELAFTPALVSRPSSMLRFLTCGSVDDGKSTLIGRMLHDAGVVPSDQLAALTRDSQRYGTNGSADDYALLVDGLEAERQQGITIDVAYRYFATPRRAFIVADTPGHEQYTRNMATGASSAELAVILVDASKGILPQTRRHSFIAATLGIRDVVLAVNKMDLVEFRRETFDAIVDEYRRAVAGLGFIDIRAIPLCARAGDNVVHPSSRMGWYRGPTLLEHLEDVTITPAAPSAAPMRMPVQWVNRRDANFRGYAGTIARGCARPGDEVRVLPGGKKSIITRIVTADGDLDDAISGQAVTLVLRDQIDISRGDVIVAETDMLQTQHDIDAQLLWTDEAPLQIGAQYEIRIGTATASARVTKLRHAVDIHSYAPLTADGLTANGIGLVSLTLDRALPVVPYEQDRELGGFILIDRMSNKTVALGMVAPEPPKTTKLRERHWRSLAKAATWRATGSVDTFLLSWLITGHVGIAGTIAGAEVLTKITLFYLHERAWAFVPWGKTTPGSRRYRFLRPSARGANG